MTIALLLVGAWIAGVVVGYFDQKEVIKFYKERFRVIEIENMVLKGRIAIKYLDDEN